SVTRGRSTGTVNWQAGLLAYGWQRLPNDLPASGSREPVTVVYRVRRPRRSQRRPRNGFAPFSLSSRASLMEGRNLSRLPIQLPIQWRKSRQFVLSLAIEIVDCLCSQPQCMLKSHVTYLMLKISWITMSKSDIEISGL